MPPTSARTSLSHPLIINTLRLSNGELGLTFCPGKKQADAMTGAWDRDIDLDIAQVKLWGATTVISLLEDFEYSELQVDNLPSVYASNFRWFSLPIPDKCAPDTQWLDNWLSIRQIFKDELAGKGKILIHCKGGFGRTGTLAALLLMDHGATATEAIARCRQARQYAVETEVQVGFVTAYELLLRPKLG